MIYRSSLLIALIGSQLEQTFLTLIASICVPKEHVLDSEKDLVLCVLEKLRGIGWTEDTEKTQNSMWPLEVHSLANILCNHVHLAHICV
jgi:hypothetical protein